MVVERVARHVGGGEDLDVEPLEQRPRPELKGAEPLCDRVVDRSGSLPRELLLDAEHVVELVVEPGTGRRATKQEIVLGEQLPHFARVAVQQRLERHAARVQEAQDVMVGLDDQRRGLRERLIGGQNPRVHMPVRRDDGKPARLVVQRARDAPDCGVRIEAAVLVEDERVRHYTTGAQPGAYARCQNFMASSSPTMRPDLGSVRSARPVDCAMLPRWPSSTLFAPSSMGWWSAAPVRIASTKFAMCRTVMSSSACVLRPSPACAARDCFTTLPFTSYTVYPSRSMTTLPVVPRMAVPRSRPYVVSPLQLWPCQIMVFPPANSKQASCVSGNSQSSSK